jgi:hypothetical protein
MSEPKKAIQFRDIMARLEDLSAKMDELLARIPPNESARDSAIVASASPRVDKNLGTLS